MTTPHPYRLTRHVKEMAARKGVPLVEVIRTVMEPDVTYPSRNHEGQERRVKGGLAVVVDPAKRSVITVYVHNEVTPLRPDQDGYVFDPLAEAIDEARLTPAFPHYEA